MTKTVGIVIDTWKLQIFTRHLNKAKVSFETHSGVTGETLLLHCDVEATEPMVDIVAAANSECARSKLH